MYRVTAGNPFFVTEVLAASGEDIPATVRDAVLARAGRLSSDARRLLEAAAVVPGRVDLTLLEALASHLIDQLEECVASGVLTAGHADVAFRQSWRASRSRSRSRLTVASRFTVPRSRHLRREEARARIRGPRRSRRRPATTRGFSAGHPRRRSGRPAAVRTARRLRSSRGRSGSDTGCQSTGARSCCSVAWMSAG